MVQREQKQRGERGWRVGGRVLKGEGDGSERTGAEGGRWVEGGRESGDRGSEVKSLLLISILFENCVGTFWSCDFS